MALLAYLGFDCESVIGDVTSQLPTGSSITGNFDSANTPYGEGRSWSSNTTYVKCALSNQSVSMVQCEFYRSTVSASARIAMWYDGATEQCNLFYNASNRKLEFRRGTTVLADSGTFQMPTTAVWVYLKVKVTVHGTTGTCLVKVNGDTWINASGLNTKVSANDYATELWIGSDNNNSVYDNVVFMDGTGASFNDLTVGNLRVYSRRPDGAGDYTQFTPSAGLNWQTVDESVQNGDTDYNSTTTAAAKDSFTFGDLPTPTSLTVHSVSIVTQARRDDAGDTSMRILATVDAADSFGPNITLSASYTNQVRRMDTKPAGGAWGDGTAFNASKFGYEKV